MIERIGLAEAEEPFALILHRSISPLASVDEAKMEPIYGVIAQGMRLLGKGNVS